jgi:hypothetical protein
VTAGFVAAMLGAKVALLSERAYLQHVQQNVKQYLKDTLDYTKMKSANVTAVPAEKIEHFSSHSLCDALNAPPPLDVVIVSESGAEACSQASMAFNFNQTNSESRLFRLLEELVPPEAPGKVLLICDGRFSFPETGFHREDSIAPLAKDERLPIEAELPLQWHVKPFCIMLQRFPVVWLERVDADVVRRQKPLAPLRRYLPPMGAASARCGCGGHPQKIFLNHRVMNLDWQENHQRLKESLILHNRWKYTENAKELDKARAFASGSICLSDSSVFMNSALLEKESSTYSDVGTLLSSPDKTNGFANGDSTSARDSFQDVAQTTLGAATLDDMTNVDLLENSCIVGEEPLNLDSSEGMGDTSGTQAPPLGAPKAPKTARSRRGFGRLANQIAKTSTIAQRHAQPPHWYRCNRVPYGIAGPTTH